MHPQIQVYKKKLITYKKIYVTFRSIGIFPVYIKIVAPGVFTWLMKKNERK